MSELSTEQKAKLHAGICAALADIESLFARPAELGTTLIIRNKVNPKAHVLETSEENLEDAFNAARQLMDQPSATFFPGTTEAS